MGGSAFFLLFCVVSQCFIYLELPTLLCKMSAFWLIFRMNKQTRIAGRSRFVSHRNLRRGEGKVGLWPHFLRLAEEAKFAAIRRSEA